MAYIVKGKKSGSKFYAVKKGFKKGIFDDWKEVSKYVNNFPGAQHKSFKTLVDAEIYMNGETVPSRKNIRSQVTAGVFRTSMTKQQKAVSTITQERGLSSLCSIDFEHYRDNIYIEKGVLDNQQDFYAVSDRLDSKSYIFKNWSRAQDYLTERRRQRGHHSIKSPINYKKINSFEGCVNYLSSNYPELEEKYFDSMALTPFTVKKVHTPMILKLDIYCDGSGANSSMGYGVFFDTGVLDERNTSINQRSLRNIYGTPPNLEEVPRSTNNIAELYALKKALEKIQLFYEDNIQLGCLLDVTIYTDSNYSLTAVQNYVMDKEQNLSLELPNESYIRLAVENYLKIKFFYKKRGLLNIFNLKWIAGHSGTMGNEKADRLANLGAFDTKNDEEVSCETP